VSVGDIEAPSAGWMANANGLEDDGDSGTIQVNLRAHKLGMPKLTKRIQSFSRSGETVVRQGVLAEWRVVEGR
jgi:hypothetical protein